MRLTVLNVAYPLAPVAPQTAGGAEQVVLQLDAALVDAGHRSIVLACEGSRVRGALVTTPPPPEPFTDEVRRAAAQAHAETIVRLLDEVSIDVIHLHGIDFLDYLPPPGPPVLVTLHLAPSSYPANAFRISRPRTWLQCVSALQEATCPLAARPLMVIENGVPEELFQVPLIPKGTHAVAVGRICPEKNQRAALDACRRAGLPLRIAGQVFPYLTHQRYFREEILPRLDSERQFLGPLAPARRIIVVGAARCLLMPSLVEETSSLAAMEALALGTPVVAFPSGALAQIVEDGRTGFLVRSEEAIAEAALQAAALDPAVCRESARRRFRLRHTMARYLELYRELAAGAAPLLPRTAGAEMES